VRRLTRRTAVPLIFPGSPKNRRFFGVMFSPKHFGLLTAGQNVYIRHPTPCPLPRIAVYVKISLPDAEGGIKREGAAPPPC
jgi:hypothetical protein